jgi:hypothetical protein
VECRIVYVVGGQMMNLMRKKSLKKGVGKKAKEEWGLTVSNLVVVKQYCNSVVVQLTHDYACVDGSVVVTVW